MNIKSNKKACVLWLVVLAWMILIFCFSAQNADTSSDTSGGFAEFLAKILNRGFEILKDSQKELLLNKCQFIVRKTAHFSIYAILGVTTLFASKFSNIKCFLLLSPAICLAYAISDEIHQSFVPGRSCELRDVCVDFSGAIFGIIVSLLIIKLFVKIKNNKIKKIKF